MFDQIQAISITVNNNKWNMFHSLHDHGRQTGRLWKALAKQVNLCLSLAWPQL